MMNSTTAGLPIDWATATLAAKAPAAEFTRNHPPWPRCRVLCTTLAGVAMHAVVMGEEAGPMAPTYVFVHGLGMSGRYMMPTATLLAAHGKVYVPDLPGFGLSGKPSHVLSISELSDALESWMAAQQLVAPVLIGNSLGAQVIVDLAVRFPDRIHRAVLVGLTIDPEARQVLAQVFRLLIDVSREPAGLYWIGFRDYLRAGLKRVLQTLRHALADPILEKLPLIRCPVLIIRGGKDPIVPQKWLELAARLVPAAQCWVLPTAAHAVNFNAPEALVEKTLKFQQQQDSLPRGVARSPSGSLGQT